MPEATLHSLHYTQSNWWKWSSEAIFFFVKVKVKSRNNKKLWNDKKKKYIYIFFSCSVKKKLKIVLISVFLCHIDGSKHIKTVSEKSLINLFSQS